MPEERLTATTVARSARSRQLELLVFLIASLLLFWKLGGHDLWAPDEPYFAEGAREMVVDGQWVVPHVNGVVTTDKPPLFFWSIAGLSLLSGKVTPWTARLPSALAAIGTLLLVLRIGRRRYGPHVAMLAVLILATTMMFWVEARSAQIDSSLCFLIWVGLAAFESWRAGESNGRRAGLLFWAALGLAVLAKGPVGLLVPLGIALVTLAVDRHFRSWKRFAPILGPIVFLAIVAAWLVPANAEHARLAGGGDYTVWGALHKHFIERALHGMHHKQPPWYYLWVLPVQLLPWSAIAPGALVLAWRQRKPIDRFLIVAALFVVLFFSISPEKRDLYILPAFPAFALLIASFLQRVVSSMSTAQDDAPISDGWLYRGQVIFGGILAVVGLALPFVARQQRELPYWMALVVAALLFACGSATLVASRRRRPRWTAWLPAMTFSVAYLFIATFVYPALEHRKSAKPFALRMAAETATWRAEGHQLLAYDLSNLPEAFAFYTDGVYTRTSQDPAVLRATFDAPGEVWAVVDRDELNVLKPEVRKQLRIVAEAELSRRPVALVVKGD